MINKILFDLSLTFALYQHCTDQIAPLTARFRWANVQRRAFTDGTIQLLGDTIDFIVGGGGALGEDSSSPKARQDEGKK